MNAMNVSPRRGLSLVAVAVVVVVALCQDVAFATVTADFDGVQMKELVDELARAGFFNGNEMLSTSVSCAGLSLAECYGLLNATYTDKVATKIVRMFHEKLVSLLALYNDAIRSYINLVKSSSAHSDENGRLKQSTLLTAEFSNSDAYCVLGLIDMHEVADLSTSVQLTDYVFYDQLMNMPGVQMKDAFVARVDEYLRWRGFTNEWVNAFGSGNDVETVKSTINRFSQPFCKLQTLHGLKWSTADMYVYKRIRTSYPLKQIAIDRSTIFNQTGVEENKTLQDLMDSVWDFKKFGEVDAYRHQVSRFLDKYVLNVLTVKVIKIVTTAMQLYYRNIKDLNTKIAEDKAIYETFYNKQHYVRSMIMSFNTLFLCYATVKPITLPRKTSYFIFGIVKSLTDSLEAQQTPGNEKENPARTIEKLEKNLVDPQFDPIDIPNKYEDALNTIDDCIESTEKVIALFGHVADEKLDT